MPYPKEHALETAACLWEAVLGFREQRSSDTAIAERAQAIDASFDTIGTSALRLIVIGWTQAVDMAWRAIADDYPLSFDWDFVPDWIIANIDWSDPANPHRIAQHEPHRQYEDEAGNPTIIVAIEGGLVNAVVADSPVELLTIDYDVDGADEDEIIPVPQDEGRVSDAIISIWTNESVTIDPAWMSVVRKAFYESRKACLIEAPSAVRDPSLDS